MAAEIRLFLAEGSDAVKNTCGENPIEDIRTALEEALLPSAG